LFFKGILAYSKTKGEIEDDSNRKSSTLEVDAKDQPEENYQSSGYSQI
jgi:hypothetical protein